MLKHKDFPDFDSPDFDTVFDELKKHADSVELKDLLEDVCKDLSSLDRESLPKAYARDFSRFICRGLRRLKNAKIAERAASAGLESKPLEYMTEGYVLLYSDYIDSLSKEKADAFARRFCANKATPMDEVSINLLFGASKNFMETDNVFVVREKLFAIHDNDDELLQVTVFWKCD